MNTNTRPTPMEIMLVDELQKCIIAYDEALTNRDFKVVEAQAAAETLCSKVKVLLAAIGIEVAIEIRRYPDGSKVRRIK